MSSFEIGKREYMKAGGFVAGFMNAFRERPMWDEEVGYYADNDTFHKWFARCYEYNAKSVAEQYGDDLQLDPEEYDDEFNTYIDYGFAVAIGRENLRECLAELKQFFSSSLYQTENDEYAEWMERLYNRIMIRMMGIMLSGIETESWSEFSIKIPTGKYETIL